MGSCILKRQILLKSIVTEDFKKTYLAKLKALQGEVEINLQKIKSSESQLLLKLPNLDYSYVMSLRESIEREKQVQESALKELQEKIKEVEELTLGGVYSQGTIEGWVEVREGDNLWDKIGQGEILIRDGVILSIKE